MKKSYKALFVSLIIVGALNLTAFAADTFFTDESSFASWFADSAKKMHYNEVMTGYPDGSFKGENSVSRAELAVILDRFAKNIFGKELSDSPVACTLEYRHGLIVKLQDQNANPITGAKITVDSLSGESFEEAEAGSYAGLGEQQGQFGITVEKDGYGTHYDTILLQGDACHVHTQTKTITLFQKQQLY